MQVNDNEYLCLLKIMGGMRHIIKRWKKYPRAGIDVEFKVIEEWINEHESLRRMADQGAGASKEVGDGPNLPTNPLFTDGHAIID